MKKWFAVLLMMLLMVSCSAPPSSQGEPEEKEKPKSVESQKEKARAKDVVTGLRVPWSLVATQQHFYISERGGAIVEVDRPKGKPIRQKLKLNKKVHHEGEGGFLGIATHADFENNGLLYAYHTYQEGGNRKNRVILLKREDGVWKEQKALLEGIPGGFIHNGGRLAIGPDKKLYITTGDGGEEKNAQNLDSLGGKILRMNPDGSVPKDNPFPGSLVYSYGHRNPQGLSWTEDGVLYSAEHGPSGDESGRDEINRIEAGKNYGWPLITGDEKKKGMVSPQYQSGERTWAPSGLASLDGKLYIAGLRGEQIRFFATKKQRTGQLFTGKGRLRDIVAVEGDLYVLTNNTDGRGTPKKEDDRLFKWSP
ncbi:PQQ-dependent sugar dehydrogenase [Kroppenstedtia sanguinis]|uniref:PQQ-dependent sugar dehydrogenase n=1 Tax=Kroppenstedtia sanguinis TaxID=1380684 RepID=A0ABW4C5H8_9BACL